MKTFKLLDIFPIILLFNLVITSCTKDDVAPPQQIPVYIPSTPQTSVYSTLELIETDTLVNFNVGGNMGIAASAGNKIFMAGGSFGAVKIYDIITEQWVIEYLSEPRIGIAAASSNNKILFAGGYYNSYSNVVDIYDVTTGQWTISHLSVARANMTATSAGNLIFFAGGIDNNGPSKVVDIYDVNTGQWTVSQLSLPRSDLAAASAGNIVCFAGGMVSGFPSNIDSTFTYRLDIYDAITGKWTIGKLSQGRTDLTGASSGNKIMFAGGWFGGHNYSSALDIYDISTGQWTIGQLNFTRVNLACTSVSNLIFFAGGRNYSDTTYFDNNIEIYNTLTGTWSTKSFPNLNLYGFNLASSAGNKILFSNGSAVDIFVLK